MAAQIPKMQIVDNHVLDRKPDPLAISAIPEKTVVSTLKMINDGGISIRVGTIGTIGSLMTREMEIAIDSPRASTSSHHRRLQMAPVSVPCGVLVPNKPHPKKIASNETMQGRDDITAICRNPNNENLETQLVEVAETQLDMMVAVGYRNLKTDAKRSPRD
ncbi:hypothetical protein QJS10_CPA09g01219 [Acorus calamus]|uniref:Uncharacterized protein n=1 Tax=Acorus calamus TaxID=4465 RepID=A0AAV9E441_ACOCL|nr:hypothetical protein QJS10_CPA09g01219 [Acorus calamus]